MSINPRLVQIMNEAQAAAGPGGHALFKWTCGGCGERVAFTQLDTLFTSAKHEEKDNGTMCGYVTDLNRRPDTADVGYALILLNVGNPANTLNEAMERRDATRGRN